MKKSTEYLMLGLLWGITARQSDGWIAVFLAFFGCVSFVQSIVASFRERE